MRLHVKEDFPNSIDGLASGMGQGNPEYPNQDRLPGKLFAPGAFPHG